LISVMISAIRSSFFRVSSANCSGGRLHQRELQSFGVTSTSDNRHEAE
jgi:hypothetical protein